MNIFDRHLAYLKDNPKNLWFKRKLYGWGWTPARWQGWAVILVFLAFVFWNASEAEEDTNGFLLRLTIGVVILIAICWKTGESPRWQWGPENKK